MSYDLTIQFDDEATATTDVRSLESFLRSYPGTRRLAWNQWIHQPHSSVYVEIDLVTADDTDPEMIKSIAVGVAHSFLAASGQPALQRCFTLAKRLGWRVFDEQCGEFIDPGDMPELLTKLVELADEPDKILAEDEASAVAT